MQTPAPYLELIESLHAQVSAFLIFTAIVECIVVFALGFLVAKAVWPRA